MALRIISRVQKLLEKEIAGSPTILCLCDYYESEESPKVARDIKLRLGGVSLNIPSERCGVAADLVKETRAKLDLDSNKDVNIFIRGGISPERIKHFIKTRLQLDSSVKGVIAAGRNLSTLLLTSMRR